ncbi:MAG: hypothetical protein JSU07_01505 [Bacteroidetes bacterium]|nr:hypothetical protein [Bacteroidota bacterium]
MLKSIRYSLIILTLLLFSSCYKDNFGERYPSSPGVVGPCSDTTLTISYSLQITPILNNTSYNCMGCHGASYHGVTKLSTYSGVAAVAQNGNLVSSVAWDNSSIQKMPQGSLSRISSCDIATIRAWVRQGYQNN